MAIPMARWYKWSLANRPEAEVKKNAKLHARLGKLSLTCEIGPLHTRAHVYPSTSSAALREAQFLCKCVYVTALPLMPGIKSCAIQHISTATNAMTALALTVTIDNTRGTVWHTPILSLSSTPSHEASTAISWQLPALV